MVRPVTASRSARLPGCVVAVVLAFGVFAVALPASAYPAPVVKFKGHGWGHGRGMGQWGALGYALDHGWGYRRVLNRFYRGTHVGRFDNIMMTVRLTRFDGKHTLVEQERGNAQTNAAPGTFYALRAVRTGTNTFRVDRAPGCGGPWTTLRESMEGPVIFRPKNRNAGRRELLQVCEPSGARRWVRGAVRSVDAAGGEISASHVVGDQRTVNWLRMEAYLMGVVPLESPAYWGNLGGGRGMHQLRAQAVAARSYAASENRYAYAKTCDSTACQVYGGVAVQAGSTFTWIGHQNTNRAVRSTAGEVRRFPDGRVARTEFSASSGGWTAGGTFPAVRDHGDDVCRPNACNPHHTWGRWVPVEDVESAWPSIGRLRSVEILKRNGLGHWGGRVLRMRFEGTDGTVTPTGNEIRRKLGLKSNWFRVVPPDR